MTPARIEYVAFHQKESTTTQARTVVMKMDRSKRKRAVPLKLDRACRARSFSVSKSMQRLHSRRRVRDWQMCRGTIADWHVPWKPNFFGDSGSGPARPTVRSSQATLEMGTISDFSSSHSLKEAHDRLLHRVSRATCCSSGFAS